MVRFAPIFAVAVALSLPSVIRAEADANLWARKIQWVFHHRDELRAETEARPASSAVTTWERSAEKMAAVYEGTEPRR